MLSKQNQSLNLVCYYRHLLTYRRFYFLAVVVFFNIFCELSDYPSEHLMRYSYLGFGLYGLLLILSFPIRIVPGLLVLGAVLSVGFTLINDKKVSLTQSPITFLDFKITALNPEGLINAVKAPSWTIFLFYILLFIFAIIALWILVNILRVMENGRKKSTFRRLALNALAFILFIGSGVFFLGQFSKSVHEFVIAKDMAWESKSFSDLPRLLSIWGVSLLFISSGENGFRRLF